MKVSELRTLLPEELNLRVRQWREEIFRARLNRENKDKSVFRKLKKDIARALTILNEKKEHHGKEA